MEVRILGSAGSEAPGLNPPAFLIDNFLLLDAGTVALNIDKIAECSITHIFLTHAHLDHLKGIPFLLDNLTAVNPTCQILVLSGKEVISDIRKHIFNNRIWPDFTIIPSVKSPVLRYQVISTRKPVVIGDYRILATRVNHTVPAYGYLVEHASGASLLYTGDSGPTEAIWKKMRGHNVKALIVEVSFPNELSSRALATGHLSPSLLEAEFRKMPSLPGKIYISHLKPPFRSQIEAELASIPGVCLEMLEEGKTFRIQ
ncbi:MAG: 3',5'-cyclic-nucleotide phosphodiesterase [Syntrophobacteraceae bacterium]